MDTRLPGSASTSCTKSGDRTSKDGHGIARNTRRSHTYSLEIAMMTVPRWVTVSIFAVLVSGVGGLIGGPWGLELFERGLTPGDAGVGKAVTGDPFERVW